MVANDIVLKKGQYNNLQLFKLADGESIEVKKLFATGKEIQIKSKFDPAKTFPMYSCSVSYNGDRCSFLIESALRKDFDETGGIGDTIKITSVQKIVKKKTPSGIEKPAVQTTYTFEKVE